MTISSRKAKPEDAAAITALVQDAYRPWIEVIGATPGPMLDDYAKLITQDYVSVRTDEQGMAEVLVLIRQGDALLIDNIAIRPDLQGQGRGAKLLNNAEVIARTGGILLMRLYVHEKMTRNIALYERNGYTITHRVTEHGLNRVYMEKRLEPWDGWATSPRT